MRQETYNWIWDQIQRNIDSIMEQIEETSPGSIGRQRFVLTYGEKTKQVIYDQYIKIRNDLKAKCYHSPPDKQDFDLIDHHKIAACFCKALIQKKVFMFDATNSAPLEMLRSNYTLAYNVSLQIVYCYLLDYYQKHEPKGCFEKLKTQSTLIAPPTTEKHDGYHLGRVKMLALNDYYGIDLDILNFSSSMYWIEHYNRQLLEENFIVDPMKLDEEQHLQGI